MGVEDTNDRALGDYLKGQATGTGYNAHSAMGAQNATGSTTSYSTGNRAKNDDPTGPILLGSGVCYFFWGLFVIQTVKGGGFFDYWIVSLVCSLALGAFTALSAIGLNFFAGFVFTPMFIAAIWLMGFHLTNDYPSFEATFNAYMIVLDRNITNLLLFGTFIGGIFFAVSGVYRQIFRWALLATCCVAAAMVAYSFYK